MKAAFELQKQINEQFPRSPHANAGRATLLQRKSRYLIAEPIYQDSLDLENEADQLAKAKEWEAAESALSKAIEIQLDINRSYRGSKQSGALRLELLKTSFWRYSRGNPI